MRFAIRNETVWCDECAHILVLCQKIMISSSSSLGCKFCHSLPFCFIDYNGRIYYVVYRFQFMSKAVIHLGVHNHPIADGKCRKLVDETRRLITCLM